MLNRRLLLGFLSSVPLVGLFTRGEKSSEDADFVGSVDELIEYIALRRCVVNERFLIKDCSGYSEIFSNMDTRLSGCKVIGCRFVSLVPGLEAIRLAQKPMVRDLEISNNRFELLDPTAWRSGDVMYGITDHYVIEDPFGSKQEQIC